MAVVVNVGIRMFNRLIAVENGRDLHRRARLVARSLSPGWPESELTFEPERKL